MLREFGAKTKEYLGYSVGALMYTPAINANIADNLCNSQFKALNSIVLCLENSIRDESVSAAEEQLYKSLAQIYEFVDQGKIDLNSLPMIFVRVRSSEQMIKVYDKLKEISSILTGFVWPKFDLANARDYKNDIAYINSSRSKPIFAMPILESESIIQVETRLSTLLQLKNILDEINEFVLNVRVGGSDFCNIYGVRRGSFQTIYDIGVINSVLSDIINLFAQDYIVSAPVWEYFDNDISDQWQAGLIKEVQLDQLNGFIGKTAIHPSQIPVIHKGLMVNEKDYADAKKILNWNDNILGVEKSAAGDRMNEVKVHSKWAAKILILADIYGVRNDDEYC